MSTLGGPAQAGRTRLPAGLQVLLVDEHAAVRAALASILRSAGLIAPCAESANGLDALARLTAFAFDLAIVDVAIPGLPGLELLRRLRAAGSTTPVLMLSMHGGSGYALRAFEAGANGYVGKDAAAQTQVAAAQAVAAGGSHVPDCLVGSVRRAAHGRVIVEPHAWLSRRELRLLRLLARGLTETEAAHQMELQPADVERSRERVAQKLGLGPARDWHGYGQAHHLG